MYNYWETNQKRRNGVKLTPIIDLRQNRGKLQQRKNGKVAPQVLDLGFKPIAPYNGNLWINESHDTDLDGVPNYRDCQPLNPLKQDNDLLDIARREIEEDRSEWQKRKQRSEQIRRIEQRQKREEQSRGRRYTEAEIHERTKRRREKALQQREKLQATLKKARQRYMEEPELPKKSMIRPVSAAWVPGKTIPSIWTKEAEKPFKREKKKKKPKQEYVVKRGKIVKKKQKKEDKTKKQYEKIKKRKPMTISPMYKPLSTTRQQQRPLKKDMSFFQAVKYFDLSAMGDADRDGVKNMFDCRPFDADKHFLKLGDIKSKLGFGGGSSNIGKFMLSVKMKNTGNWVTYPNPVTQNEANTILNDMFERGQIVDSKTTKVPLKTGERAKLEMVKAGVGMGSFVKQLPSDVRKYTRGRKELWKENIKEELTSLGLGRKPEPDVPEWMAGKPTYHIVEKKEPGEVVVKDVYKEKPEKPINMYQKREYSGEVEEAEEFDEPQKMSRRGMPPYSKGWAGSIGGSRPYRPLKYKPTGKIWKPERVHDPNPKIQSANIQQFKPPERYHQLNAKIPVFREGPYGWYVVNPNPRRQKDGEDEMMYMDV